MNSHIFKEEASGILIVDDNDINRDICAMNLSHLNIPLFFADNGVEGLEIARAEEPDLILLDIMMPKMDGFEMLKQLKADTRLTDIPVLMLTAKNDTADVVRALNGGARDYLKKPFAEEEMVARVNTLLNNRLLEKRHMYDIMAGARMQQKFLTDVKSAQLICKAEGFSVNIFNRSYSAISGDFFSAYKTSDGNLVFFLGDSCGHGLPAALLSMRILGSLQLMQNIGSDPSEALTTFNNDIVHVVPHGSFLAACQAHFHEDTVSLCNSGQPYPILVSGSNCTEVELDGLPMGMVENVKYEPVHKDFCKGDHLLLYTDGIIETCNRDGEIFGRERLLQLLQSVQASGKSNGEDFINKIKEDLQDFEDGLPIDDDQTLVILTRL